MLIRSEAEQLVLDDWTAEGAAKDFQIGPPEIGLIGTGRADNGRVSQSIEFGIAPIGDRSAVISVGSRLHVQDNHAAGAVAVFRINRVLLEGYFLHRIEGRRVGTLVTGYQRHAIKQDVVGPRGLSTYVDVTGIRVVVGTVLV